MCGKGSRELPLLAASLLAVAAVSCGNGQRQAVVPGYTLIDNMEVTGGRIAWSPPGGWEPGLRAGFWTSSTDCSQGERILPEPYFVNPFGWSYDPVPEAHPTMPGVTSTHAAHLRTKFDQPLQNVWGANIGFDFAEEIDADGGASWPPAAGIDAGAPATGPSCRKGSSRDFNGATVDLSAYSGITFWAMASPYGRQAIRVQFNDVTTDPRGDLCAAPGSTVEEDCYNAFGQGFMLTDTFTQYRVDFSEAWQDPGWGYRSGALRIGDVYSLNFQVPLPGCTTDNRANCAGAAPPVSFDVWIDDIYFVNRQ